MNGRKYEVRYRLLKFMAASVSQNGRFRAVFLSVIMVLMTQVGYTDNMDFSIDLNQDTESKDTGGSTPALTPSVEGADLTVDVPMSNITFQYGTGAASGSSSSTCIGTACMVKDINVGGNSFNVYPPVMVTVGNTLYFVAEDGTNGEELWKSDGTASGTMMVKDINVSGNGASWHNNVAVIGNTLYFTADDGTNGNELWKTDGTASGTVMVKDINSGSSTSNIQLLTPIGNTIYLSLIHI